MISALKLLAKVLLWATPLMKGLQYQKEAKLLCRKIVNFFSLLSKTYEIGVRRLGITQELLSLVTGLAHYLKILIRLALTASLRLVSLSVGPVNNQEQDFNDSTALHIFLDTLGNLPAYDAPQPDHNITPTSDSCVECQTTIEESCVKLALPDSPYRCWHSKCLRCSMCRRLLVHEQALWNESKQKVVCDSCRMRNAKDLPDLRSGFEKSTLLMQFIFLLRVALARLGSILRDNKALPHTSGTTVPTITPKLIQTTPTSHDTILTTVINPSNPSNVPSPRSVPGPS